MQVEIKDAGANSRILLRDVKPGERFDWGGKKYRRFSGVSLAVNCGGFEPVLSEDNFSLATFSSLNNYVTVDRPEPAPKLVEVGTLKPGDVFLDEDWTWLHTGDYCNVNLESGCRRYTLPTTLVEPVDAVLTVTRRAS